MNEPIRIAFMRDCGMVIVRSINCRARNPIKKNVTIIGTPPSNGIGLLWIFLPPVGLSTIFNCVAFLIVSFVKIKERSVAPVANMISRIGCMLVGILKSLRSWSLRGGTTWQSISITPHTNLPTLDFPSRQDHSFSFLIQLLSAFLFLLLPQDYQIIRSILV